jgi:hypothetical protein
VSTLALVGAATAFTGKLPKFGGVFTTTGSAKSTNTGGLVQSGLFMAASEEKTVCDMPDVDPTDLMSRKGSAQALRTAMLTNAAGEVIPLGQVMGQGSSLVVFLRHLG